MIINYDNQDFWVHLYLNDTLIVQPTDKIVSIDYVLKYIVPEISNIYTFKNVKLYQPHECPF